MFSEWIIPLQSHLAYNITFKFRSFHSAKLQQDIIYSTAFIFDENAFALNLHGFDCHNFDDNFDTYFEN